MKLIQWINFESEGEKQKLVNIMENNTSDIKSNLKIQEEFGLDLRDAQKVIEIYKSRKIKK